MNDPWQPPILGDPPRPETPAAAAYRIERETAMHAYVERIFAAYEADIQARLVQLRRDLFGSLYATAEAQSSATDPANSLVPVRHQAAGPNRDESDYRVAPVLD